ncbi:MAG: nucleotide sugar dehydrogenase, partial [bacterium]|nr:nucleotide sugar dehydrogenase [bacterium]
MISIAPDGTQYQVLTDFEIDSSFQEILTATKNAKLHSQEIVVVQGLGFVGTALASVVANCTNDDGKQSYFVIGVDLNTENSYWKIGKILEGKSPIGSPDPQINSAIHNAVYVNKNLTATASLSAYEIADVIVVDIPLDVKNIDNFKKEDIQINIDSFSDSIRTIGKRMMPDALVLIETTVPVGTTKKIVLPILEEERRKRGITSEVLLAHSYERVMPGPNYFDSIRNFWRVMSAVNDNSKVAAEKFLNKIINTEKYPLTKLEDTYSSELAKILENSYRAMNIAFMYEWTLMAENIGVNLFAVVEAIKMRKGTHDNIRYPGFGVGGYCLTKDSFLAQWSLENLFHSQIELSMTVAALRINYNMPLHVLDMMSEYFQNNTNILRVLLCGISYLPNLSDTRNSPSQVFVEGAIQKGIKINLHDPHVHKWFEKPDLEINNTLDKFSDLDCMIFAVGHQEYLRYEIKTFRKVLKPGALVIDAQNVLNDKLAIDLHNAGYKV